MATTYKDLYNAPTRALQSILMGWQYDVAVRFRDDTTRYIAAGIAISGIWMEWARTHETRPARS